MGWVWGGGSGGVGGGGGGGWEELFWKEREGYEES